MTIRRMRIACWIPKATDTHSEYVILFGFPLQQWLHESASVLRCTYIVVFRIFLSCLVLCNTSSLFTRSFQLVFSILLHHHFSKLSDVSDFQNHTKLCSKCSTLPVSIKIRQLFRQLSHVLSFSHVRLANQPTITGVVLCQKRLDNRGLKHDSCVLKRVCGRQLMAVSAGKGDIEGIVLRQVKGDCSRLCACEMSGVCC